MLARGFGRLGAGFGEYIARRIRNDCINQIDSELFDQPMARETANIGNFRVMFDVELNDVTSRSCERSRSRFRVLKE
jgi:hypothetical protein